ncbi:tRNA 2-thiouridine(34) synthase MnmA [Aestuariimicrobium kwangyangense]|uniref:tRNA 2-thiouridine(34) synthase MnmA n=1 Tax=Aestuariimicrobium kwangyangense TaxID=396389 RepID=UPI00047EF1CF|nr:tRNA 2-thiouridine(34) synthase MnmA [Aestuariimicrobium kwangyangense]
MRVLAAMSGGVDSAVAAARMVAAGHDVTGVHLALSKNPESYRSGARGCCSLEDSHDARRAADKLGIPFYVWDFAERFHADVVEDFVAEYAAGRTPNPCLRCNEKIKFAAVLDRGLQLGFDVVATGHYARLTRSSAGQVELRRAADPAKDQSYVLGVLDAHQLAHCAFPLGDTHKTDVRAEAAALGLGVAKKPDSHDICFIPDGDTAGFLTRQLGERVGEVVDTAGRVVGSHPGHHQFTVGQRRGLHLGVPADDGRPRFVLSIEPVQNRVTVGAREHLAVGVIDAIRPILAGAAVPGRWRGHVQVRAHGVPMPATVEFSADALHVELDHPCEGIAPGQAAVVYADDRVVGSATISGTR